jgi:ADP-heptose:LPS heptosyltransferase/predicted ATP-grasp superfamily ATP-dependent carboligase
MKAIVTDANNRIALTVVRSLGSRGITVACVGREEFASTHPLCFYSRYCAQTSVLPDAEFIERLKGIARPEDVLIPVSTDMVELVSRRSAELDGRVRFLIPEYSSFTLANDKGAVIEYASRLGIPAPKTVPVDTYEQLEACSRRIRYPAVIKIRNDLGINLRPEQKYRIARDAAELEAFYRSCAAVTTKVVVQEYIEGPGYGFEALFGADSRVQAYFCHRRLREYPVCGGPSSFCESVREPQLIEYGIKLLSELGWKGVAMLEFKKDSVDGRFKLIEVNPKFWGTLALAVRCGVDFPFLLYGAAQGKKAELPGAYQEMIKLRFLWLDIAAAFQLLRKSKRKLRMIFSLIRELLDPTVKEGLFSFRDIRPSVLYAVRRLVQRERIPAKIPEENIRSILVVNLGGIGDVLMSTPALRSLRTAYPRARITVWVVPRAQEVIEGLSYVDKIVCSFTALRKNKFDMAINMRPLNSFKGLLGMAGIFLLMGAKYRIGRDTEKRGFFYTHKTPETYVSRVHEVEHQFNLVKLLDPGAKLGLPEMAFSGEDSAAARRFLQEAGIQEGDLVIGVNPGAAQASKQWPLENFAEVIVTLQQKTGCRIIVTGGASDIALAGRLNGMAGGSLAIAAGKLSLKQFAVLSRRFSLFLTNDTGAMHIAASQGVPMVAIFKPGHSERNKPYMDAGKYVILVRDLPCSPCRLRVCPTLLCLRRITSEEVAQASLGLLQK